MMSVAEQVYQKVRELPPEKQEAVLAFTDSLVAPVEVKKPRRSAYGRLSHLDIHLSFEDFKQARRECWASIIDDPPADDDEPAT